MKGKELIRRLYAPDYMLKNEKKLADSYSTSKIYRTFYRIAWPATLECVLIGLVSFIDTAMVSTVGDSAIAAVGLTVQPRMLFYALFFALSVGVTAIVSRRKGENDKDAANRCLCQALLICLLLNIIVCVLAMLYARPLLNFVGAKDDTIDNAITYFKITIIGMFFTNIGLMINSALRGSGTTKISMVTNLTANVVNIIFNYLLINGIWFFPRLEVKGAAIATLLGNVASCLLSIISILRGNGFIKLKFSDFFKFDGKTTKLIFKIGSSSCIEQIFIRLGFIVFVKLVADLGTTAFATHQICLTIVNLTFTLGDGMSIAASSLIGQNLGKKRPDLAIIYGKSAQRIGLLMSLCLIFLFAFGGEMLMKLFSEDPAIIETGVKILVIIAISTPAQLSLPIYIGCLRGAGDTRFVAFITLITITIIRTSFTYLFCYIFDFGVIGAWIATAIDQYVRLLIASVRFSKGKWCNIKI